MSLHLFLSSAALFNSPYVFLPDPFSISCIHVSFGLPCFLIPSTCPSRICRCDTPADPLKTCPAYLIFRFIISLTKCNSVCILLRTSLFLILFLKLQYLSVAPHLQCVYFLSHLLVPCPTFTPVASYREHIAVENLQLYAQADIPSHYFFVLPKSSSSHSHSCSYILLTPCIF